MKAPSILVAVALLCAFLLPAAPAQAAAIDGSWSGSGYLAVAQGQRERVRCRVTYSRQTPTVYSVSATCASPSAQVRQSGTLLKVSATSYVGDIYNAEFDVSGRVRVVVRGNSQTVTFQSSAASGQLSLRKR